MRVLALPPQARRAEWLPRSSALAVGVVAALAAAPRLGAQTDYYNTDLGRPLQVEDYLALERYGLELQAAPLRVERGRGGVYQ
jgi:hypothetical protein